MSNEQWSEWKDNVSGKIPAELVGEIVSVKYRDGVINDGVIAGKRFDSQGSCRERTAGDWSIKDESHDIIAYRYRLDDDTMTPEEEEIKVPERNKVASDGTTASYYELPEGATELYHLIIHKNMNAQLGEIFRAAYRYGESSHSDQLRDARKIKAYIEQEIERLEKRCIG